jgi:hypothetical protein
MTNEAYSPSKGWWAPTVELIIGFVCFSGEAVGLFAIPSGAAWDMLGVFITWVGLVSFLGFGWGIAIRLVPDEEEKATLRSAQVIFVNFVCTSAAILSSFGVEKLLENFRW